MPEIVTVRSATLSDAPRVAELCGVLGYPVSADLMAERLARAIDRSEDIVLVAVLVSGRIAGWLHASELQLLEMGRYAQILGLVVDAEHRSLGVGRELVARAEAWTLSRSLADLHVCSNVVRAESHPFYQRLGFVRVKTQHVYRKALKREGT